MEDPYPSQKFFNKIRKTARVEWEAKKKEKRDLEKNAIKGHYAIIDDVSHV